VDGVKLDMIRYKKWYGSASTRATAVRSCHWNQAVKVCDLGVLKLNMNHACGIERERQNESALKKKQTRGEGKRGRERHGGRGSRREGERERERERERET
jgi:hypothetical protein